MPEDERAHLPSHTQGWIGDLPRVPSGVLEEHATHLRRPPFKELAALPPRLYFLPWGKTPFVNVVRLAATGTSPVKLLGMVLRDDPHSLFGEGGGADYEMELPPLPTWVEPGGTLEIPIRYRPRNTALHFALLDVLTDAPGSRRVRVHLVGKLLILPPGGWPTSPAQRRGR